MVPHNSHRFGGYYNIIMDHNVSTVDEQLSQNLKDYPQHSHFDELLNHRNLKKTYRKPRLYSIYNNIKKNRQLVRSSIRWGPEADSVINLEYGLLEICFDGIDNNFLKHITNLYYLFPLQSLYREYRCFSFSAARFFCDMFSWCGNKTWWSNTANMKVSITACL
ncbi:unnamed protein product [Mytilus coruscus]|uniref:Uncharacterized protein n=1 Tax=Mytilus coruscus TaxID=42192 RepID=A0A6J8AZS5_MYTCO|nr:unnamed protein product [Mytilus coruscus]